MPLTVARSVPLTVARSVPLTVARSVARSVWAWVITVLQVGSMDYKDHDLQWLRDSCSQPAVSIEDLSEQVSLLTQPSHCAPSVA